MIDDPDKFESNLRDWIRDATNPPVMGVEYQSYAGPDGKGFVVCLVPESSHKPHRAERAKKHYYYRTGDDFQNAEPAMLRMLFYPKYSADFSIEFALSYEDKAIGSLRVTNLSLGAFIHNTERVTASDVYVVAVTDAAIEDTPWLMGTKNWGAMDASRGKATLAGLIPLHPNFPSQLFSTNEWKPQSQRVDGNRVVPVFHPFKVDLHVYSRDTEYKRYHVEFSADDFAGKTLCQRKSTAIDEA